MNIDNFTNRAEAYAKGRPGYPKEAIEKIMEFVSSDTIVADIGAGTGIFTKELAKYGNIVYAVEPNADMRKQLMNTLQPYASVKIVDGTAETTTLPDHSVNIITVAHALHWFQFDAFRTECERIIMPDGWIMVLYNHVPGKEMTDFCRKAVDNFLPDPMVWSFYNPIQYTWENWLAYITSQDDSPMPDGPRYEDHVMALKKEFERNSTDGLLCCDRITKIYCERMADI